MTDSKHDFLLMSEIANRGIVMLHKVGGMDKTVKKLDLMMDIEYTNDETPLDLEKFLAFDNGNFAHDIFGIHRNFTRATMKLNNSSVTPRR